MTATTRDELDRPRSNNFIESLFSARIGQRELAQLCRRVATGLEAGVDIRRVWKREADGYTSSTLRKHLNQIVDAINRGETIHDALAQTGDYFPRLLHELIDVGEQSGKLSEVLRRLADHYEHQVRLRRDFMAAITWPMMQLAAALGVIGLVIILMGFLPTMADGKPMDILGLGLAGGQGFVVYCLTLAGAAAGIYAIVQAVRRGLAWTRPVQLLLMQIPWLGTSLRTLAMAKLAWTMSLTMDAGMDLLRALPLCLRSTGSIYYSDHTAEIVQAIRAGHEITEAFADTKVFPREFLDMLDAGERAGRLPETMQIVSADYQDQAQRALTMLTKVAGYGVWGLVVMLIVSMIFRVAATYLGMLESALKF
jgi:type IV pilus assembly protein PilC